MDSLTHLNAFITERLAAAAVEIFGAVEKTLADYRKEISRSKQELDHLRSLVLWPEVRLHRSAAHQLSPLCCDKESAPDVSPGNRATLHVKEEHDRRTDQRGPSCRQQCDTLVSPQTVKRGHRDPSLHLHRILHVEQTSNIKAEPDNDELITSTASREAEIRCRRTRESLKDSLEMTDDAQDWPDDHRYPDQDWSLCEEPGIPDPPQIKVEKLTSSSLQEETMREYDLPLKSKGSVYDESHSSCHDQALYPTEQKRDAEREAVELSRLTRAQLMYSLSARCPASQDESDENAEGVAYGESIKVHPLTGTRKKKRKYSNLCYNRSIHSIAAEGDVNDLTKERRHTCPICAKRFKESSHLKEHVRIHTGEKPYQCKLCGVNFRQSGALTLHMRIHTGERPYQCNDCGRRFNRKGDMESHMVTHTGERPHLCMVCGKSYRRKSNLNTHLKVHTESKKDYMQPL